MPGHPAMKSGLRGIRAVVDSFSRRHGWEPGGYEIYVYPNEMWGYIMVHIVGPSFPGKGYNGQWEELAEHFDREMKNDPDLRNAITLSFATYARIAAGKPDLRDKFDAIEDWIGPAVPAHS